MTGFIIYQKKEICTCPIVQTILATSIDRNKYLNKNNLGVKKERPRTKKGLLKSQNGLLLLIGIKILIIMTSLQNIVILGAQGLLMLMGSKFLIKMTRQQNKGHDDQNFYSYLKARYLGRPFWFHLFFNKAFLVLGCSFLHLWCFCLDITSFLKKYYL